VELTAELYRASAELRRGFAWEAGYAGRRTAERRASAFVFNEQEAADACCVKLIGSINNLVY